jgi:hypothetical protein
MTVKTSDEILLFLVKNSEPVYFDDIWKIEDFIKKKKQEILKQFILSLSSCTSYMCEIKKFEQFVGEPYNFEKHLRTLYEDGILFFPGVPRLNDEQNFYSQPKYIQIFSGTNGTVKNYNSGEIHIKFYYRENSFLKHYKNIITYAEKLGLIKEDK